MNFPQYSPGSQSKPPRRTFFSFHYSEDVSRAQVVRNSWVTKESREDAGFFDASVFESKQRASEDALKQFLTAGLNGTTVTCVLIGAKTAIRPWVRYELFRSFQRGNGIFGIKVHNIKNLNGTFGTAGANPLACVAYRVEDDRVTWLQLTTEGWRAYERIPSMPLSDVSYNLESKHNNTFSSLFPIYDWSSENGYENLGTWVERAAQQAGK